MWNNKFVAKPFVKWVGGKKQLISQLDALLPADFRMRNDVRYIEPFVGGGAMLIYMLQTYPNITSAVINDINADLTKCYLTVRDDAPRLVKSLNDIQEKYYSFSAADGQQRQFYYEMRDRFNAKPSDNIENTTLFIFLNRTCFNGLYRVNKSGRFNVPFGKYERPMICDPPTILADSRLLRNVEILTGDFGDTIAKIKGDTLFYLDPPYRPLSCTSSFNDYSKEAFGDEEQRRLKLFCDQIDSLNAMFMLSNSDCFGKDGKDRFFDDLYQDYNISRVWASRSVNANPAKRGKLTEIVVDNFCKTKEHQYHDSTHARAIQQLYLPIADN